MYIGIPNVLIQLKIIMGYSRRKYYLVNLTLNCTFIFIGIHSFQYKLYSLLFFSHHEN